MVKLGDKVFSRIYGNGKVEDKSPTLVGIQFENHRYMGYDLSSLKSIREPDDTIVFIPNIRKGDIVKLIDKFYKHEAFKKLVRYHRKDIANQSGKELKILDINCGQVSYSAKDDGLWTIPIELLEKVEELPKVPKQGDLFRVVSNTSPLHFYDTGDVVRLVMISSSGCYVCERSDGRNQHVHPGDLEPYAESAHERLERVSTVFAEWKHGGCKNPAKHRYTDEQIAEAERIIGEIVASLPDWNNYAFSRTGRRTHMYINNQTAKKHAVCKETDEYNQTIGRMIVLCRHVGRALPDWL